ncbi:MAG: nucleotidyltransferase domain-containing protein [Candidatus Micrarchaeota archaeon]
MVQNPNLAAARAFKKELSRAFRESVKVILFGSRARGNYYEDSDYDFIVVSKAFQGVHELDRYPLVRKHWKTRAPVDVLCYTPQEARKASRFKQSILRKALDFGVAVP